MLVCSVWIACVVLRTRSLTMSSPHKAIAIASLNHMQRTFCVSLFPLLFYLFPNLQQKTEDGYQ